MLRHLDDDGRQDVRQNQVVRPADIAQRAVQETDDGARVVHAEVTTRDRDGVGIVIYGENLNGGDQLRRCQSQNPRAGAQIQHTHPRLHQPLQGLHTQLRGRMQSRAECLPRIQLQNHFVGTSGSGGVSPPGRFDNDPTPQVQHGESFPPCRRPVLLRDDSEDRRGHGPDLAQMPEALFHLPLSPGEGLVAGQIGPHRHLFGGGCGAQVNGDALRRVPAEHFSHGLSGFRFHGNFDFQPLHSTLLVIFVDDGRGGLQSPSVSLSRSTKLCFSSTTTAVPRLWARSSKSWRWESLSFVGTATCTMTS